MRKKIALTLALLFLLTSSPQVAQGKDLKIWDSLQGSNPKGYVLLMRHALAPGVGDPDNFSVNDCSTQRNLSPEGKQDARDIGAWLKRQKVKIYRVESSRWCRARDTAQLLNIGKVRSNRNLDSLFQHSDPNGHPQTTAIRKRIIDHRERRGLLVLVGHYVNFMALTGVALDSGEGVLVRASADGKIEVKGYSPAP
jgi:phosphohistidine phosphatase SixA